jgi:HK97 family phage major capsid protein
MSITPQQRAKMAAARKQIEQLRDKVPHMDPAERADFQRLCATHKALSIAEGERTPTPARSAIKDELSATQSLLRAIEAKGDRKMLRDVKTEKMLHAKTARLNAEVRASDDAEVKRAVEKFRVKAAMQPETIDPTHPANTAAELRNAALRGLDRESYRLPPPVAYHSAFQKSLSPKPVFTPAEGEALRRYREIYRDEIRAAAESGSFGLAIPFTLDPAIQAAGQELAPIVAAATTKVVNTNVWHGVASVGSSFAIAAEGAVIADDAATLTGPSIPLYAGKAFIPYSTEVSQDWPSFRPGRCALPHA